MVKISVKQVDATHWKITPENDATGWIVCGKTKDDAINAFTSWSVYSKVHEVEE